MSDWKVLINQKLTQFVYFVNHLNRRQLAFLSTLFFMGFLLLSRPGPQPGGKHRELWVPTGESQTDQNA